jgi:hypothetical protein
VEGLQQVDQALLDYFRKTTVGKVQVDGLGLNLVRACSEGISIAVAKTMMEDPK